MIYNHGAVRKLRDNYDSFNDFDISWYVRITQNMFCNF